MLATPHNTAFLGTGLDHPEGVCIGPGGEVYAGGEAGQLYVLNNGGQRQFACTGGFILCIALDGTGRIHACDTKHRALLQIDPGGQVTARSTGTAQRKMVLPNYPVFDRSGNLFVSDSGDYYSAAGTGCIFVIRATGHTELFHAGPFRFANGLALHPSGEWLYVVQSTAANVVRIPLSQPNGTMEVTHQLPSDTVPDGLAFAADGRLVITCYKPDAVYLGHPGGRIELLLEDPTAEVLMRPTNAALHGGKLYLANLGGWHIAVVETELQPAPVYRPVLP